jgi:hypothetical protein
MRRFAFDGRCNFLKPLFQALEGLCFDHGAHLRQLQTRLRASAWSSLLSRAWLAVDSRRLSYESGERVEWMTDQRALAGIRFWVVVFLRGGGL